LDTGPILPLIESDSEESVDSDATREYFTKEKLAELASGHYLAGPPDGDHRMTYILPNLWKTDANEDDTLDFGISGDLRKWVVPNTPISKGNCPPNNDDVYVVRHYLATNTSEVVIEREMNILTLAEAQKHVLK
jgi:hypothetical protein